MKESLNVCDRHQKHANCTERKAVEAIRKELPQLGVIPTLAFIIETIKTINTSRFVIAAKKKDVFWILHFVGKEKTNHFQRLFASINKI